MEYGPVIRERPDRYGSVPGLDDEELADPAELERGVLREAFGLIMDLPVKGRRGWTRPTFDDYGNSNAFLTVDFERMYGAFDRYRYSADKLREELEFQIIMLSVIIDRVPRRSKYQVLRYLNMGVIDLDHVENPDMHAIGRRYLRCQRLRRQIRRLCQLSRRGWCDPEEN